VFLVRVYQFNLVQIGVIVIILSVGTMPVRLVILVAILGRVLELIAMLDGSNVLPNLLAQHLQEVTALLELSRQQFVQLGSTVQGYMK
jgi:hypothetical protein